MTVYEHARTVLPVLNTMAEVQDDLRRFNREIQFRIPGEPPFIVAVTDGVLSVRPGELGGHPILFEGVPDAWHAILDGEMEITRAYDEDRIYFVGLAAWRPQISWMIRLIRQSRRQAFWERRFFREVG